MLSCFPAMCRLGCVVDMYTCIQTIIQRNSLWYMKYIAIVIEGTEILVQCLNHGGSY